MWGPETIDHQSLISSFLSKSYAKCEEMSLKRSWDVQEYGTDNAKTEKETNKM